MTLSGYTPTPNYVDESATWTVTVTNPCTSQTNINAFARPFVTMTATVLGPTIYQRFSHVTDSYSVSWDTVNTYYAVPDNPL